MSEKIAPYAVNETNSKGRVFAETSHPYRCGFERDRDRIIHSAAFRRLKDKTQVFASGVNDFYHTRLTHTIEVAQIGRTIAKALNLNEALTEAICLGHDLGHSPFGHNGEKTLNEIMADDGGFEHNAQSLRIVDWLERPYPNFKGLNLMHETRLGFAKHHSTYDDSSGGGFEEKSCSLEGQIADLADRIAYNCHDLDDGMHARLITLNQVKDIDICSQAAKRCEAAAISDSYIRNTRIVKTIVDVLVSDCIETSKTNIVSANPSCPEDVYNMDGNLIGISELANEKLAELEKFLYSNMYEHPMLKLVSIQSVSMLRNVFDKFCTDPVAMPKFYQSMIDESGLQRTVCDYISGMTDRYCMEVAEGKV